MPKLLSFEEKEDFILNSILIFIWVEFLWEFYLSIRQYKTVAKTTDVPDELKDILNKEEFVKSRQYDLDKSSFQMVQGVFSEVLLTVMIIFELNVVFWNWSSDLIRMTGYDYSSSEILRSLVMILITNVINVFINLPFSIYHTFVIEEKHGFNKQTIGFYLKDQLKKFIVSQVIMLPIISVSIYIIQIGGDYFFFYLWIFTTVITLFLMTVYPDYIAPLFDKYTPLQEGELRVAIEELATKIKFPLTKIYIVEGSKRSVHSNAYFYGFFNNKRIVLFDTLLIKKESGSEDSKDKEKDAVDKESTADIDKDSEKESYDKEEKVEDKDQRTELLSGDGEKKSDGEKSEVTMKQKGCTNDEIVAILGHELGHWKCGHVLKNMIISQANLFLILFMFGMLYKYQPLYGAFGFHDEQPIIIGLVVILQFVFSPYYAVLSFMMTILSRHFEFQADRFAKNLGYENFLKTGLIKLHKDNLSTPVYDWLYSAWHLSHPPLLDRIKALEEKKKED